MVLLDRSEDEVLHAIEGGALAWAWDIRSPGAERRELRVWRDSVLAVMRGQRDPETTEDKVMASILPARDIRSPELQRLWSCSSTHIHTLMDAGQIATAAAPAAARGPASYAVITRASAAAFLRLRRIT